MKTPEQMREQFHDLYSIMANSKNVAFMRAFGNAHKEMMEWFIVNKPDLAEEWLSKLESIKWHNYLTPKEAENIVANMKPDAPWSRDAWKKAMDSFGIATEEEPYYNSCALWVTMNMEYSDSARSIASLLGKTVSEVPTEQMVKAVHSFALDKLKDADHRFHIRSYFGL